jgi:hypothetical protein
VKQRRLSLFLDDDLALALLAMSQADCRTPTLEAMWILREEAKRRNLDSSAPPPEKPELQGMKDVAK